MWAGMTGIFSARERFLFVFLRQIFAQYAQKHPGFLEDLLSKIVDNSRSNRYNEIIFYCKWTDESIPKKKIAERQILSKKSLKDRFCPCYFGIVRKTFDRKEHIWTNYRLSIWNRQRLPRGILKVWRKSWPRLYNY